MNKQETLFFVGKCLSLAVYPEKAEAVRTQIQHESIDWELVVKISSSQLVLPALFLNMKRTSLLNELPDDLVEYLEYLTQQNRDRNQQILEEIEAIAKKLNANGISPIFLKGTAQLLMGLYGDIGERMIGDIDFLVADDEMLLAAKILEAEAYTPLVAYDPYIHANAKHLPRLGHKTRCAAVEIHREVLHFPNHKKFGFKDIDADKVRIDGDTSIYVPSPESLIIHNMLHTQLNDKAFLKGALSFRQMYDFLLLSTKINPVLTLCNFGKYKKFSNAWLAVTHKYFDKSELVKVDESFATKLLFKRIRILQLNSHLARFYLFVIFIYGRIQSYSSLLYYSIINKDERKGLVARLKNPRWYINHFLFYKEYFTGKR